MKKGNTLLKEKPPTSSLASFLERMNASAIVTGIMASVLVSLTVTALSRVCEPSEYMLSQVDAAAVTLDVSLTAVPANIPNASPDVCENPIRAPRFGNIIAAITLKKNITEIA